MDRKYTLRRLTLAAPRLTWQAALLLATFGSAVWLTAVGIARVWLHAG